MTLTQINKFIEENGLTKKHIAKQIGITPEYFNNILKGKVVPGNLNDTLKQIETYFKKTFK